MPTNRVTKGNSLTSLVLQPGWTIENDGFGLLTCTATYIASHGNDAGTSAGTGSYALTKAPSRGTPFEKDARLTCHRASSSLNSNGLLVVTANYVGIANGNMTNPEVSGRGTTTTEPIATFPTFTSVIGGKQGEEKNGAVFNDDGSFKVFADPAYKKYGVKSYYSPTLAINGHFYTSDIKVPKTLLDSQLTTSADGQWKNIKLIGRLDGLGTPYGNIGNWSAPDESPQLLLCGLGVEDFGTLMKVSYEILVAYDGWDIDLYPYATQGRPRRDAKL